MTDQMMHIGRVADITGLSLRTIRYYEEIGLVTPSGRSAGGFRQYGEEDVDRLLLIKRMKPLGYPLDEMAKLLALVDALSSADGAPAEAVAELHAYTEGVQQRIRSLETELAYAKEFRDRILSQMARRGVAP